MMIYLEKNSSLRENQEKDEFMNDIEVTKKSLNELLTSQKLAVLSTSSEGNSYASLVAFAATGDMKELIFATARATRKYEKLSHNSHVAMLIDSRSHHESDFHEAVAATAVGNAEEVQGPEKDKYLALYLKNHPHLIDFVKSPSCALIRVKVACYYFVSRFQNVVNIHIR